VSALDEPTTTMNMADCQQPRNCHTCINSQSTPLSQPERLHSAHVPGRNCKLSAPCSLLHTQLGWDWGSTETWGRMCSVSLQQPTNLLACTAM
jgi:hypothetical protein